MQNTKQSTEADILTKNVEKNKWFNEIIWL